MEIMGKPVATLEQWTKYVKAQNCERFQSIIEEYYQQTQWGIRPDVLVSQFIKEVGVGGSFWGDRHNFCGLGVTGEHQQPFPGEPGWAWDVRDKEFHRGWAFYDTPSGVAAHYGHMMGYTTPSHAHGCDLYDPRHYVFGAGHKNEVSTVEGIAARWNGNPKYGTALVTFLNKVIAL